MGKASSKLSPEQLTDLQRHTYFDKKELQIWYRGFLKEAPAGHLDRNEFHRQYRQYFPFGDPTSFADLIFDVFDRNKNGVVDFREYMMALSTSSRGKPDERLECMRIDVAWHDRDVGAFQLYDIDGDGFISREEMMRVVSAMYRMMGSMVPLPVGEETPEKRVNKIFELVDTDGDGRISFREFKEGCRNDPSIAQGIAMYDGMV